MRELVKLVLMFVIFSTSLVVIQEVAEARLQKKINRHLSMLAHPSSNGKKEWK